MNGRAQTSGRGPAPHTMTCPACSATYPPDTRFCPVDGSILKPITTEGELVGSILDERYYLVEMLGQGGMGEVYRGEHVLTRRQCAVKVVSRTLSDPDTFGRFVREATNAGRINHPHVATIYDFGKTEDGLLYLAMEYVDGEPLSTLLEREGALTPARAVEIAQQVAQAVAAAHELGIVHRDLKPGNIVVARDRKGADLIKVVDFGIARATEDEQQHLTRTGFVIGTPEYMSPEQLIGDPVDGRTDIYALGCILYQMLTGQPAFGGSNARLITRRLTEKPPRPRDVNRAIPKALDEVVVRALGRMPQDRYQTMDELRNALLAAPAQPGTTAPRRLAAWLGLSGGKGEGEGGGGNGRAAAEPAGRATAENGAEPDSPAASIAEATQSAAAESPEETAAATAPAVGAEGDSAKPAEERLPPAAAPSRPRRSIGRKIAAAAGALVVTVAAALMLQSRDREPEAPATFRLETPGPVPLVADSALAEIRGELLAVERQIVAEQYVAAIVRLHAVETRLAGLAAMFPARADVRLLIDSTSAQLERIERRCNALKKLAAERNEPSPVCEVS